MKVLAGVLSAALVIAALTAVAYATWQNDRLRERAEQMERLITVSWGDGAGHPAFYGAYVYYEPQADGRFRVLLAVRIDRSTADDGYQHEPREIGMATSPEGAVAKWGTVTWSPAGLMVGAGPDAYLFPRAELERHR